MAFSPLPSRLEEALKEIKMWRETYTKQKFTPQPAQKPLVGLTDEEIEMIVENKRAAHWEFIRQVEAKLKEKNT